MKIIFLGTSSGVPTKKRNVSGMVVKMTHSKSWYLIDCGEGTQHQILHTNLSLNNLKAIFITHIHGDHCFGLPGLLSSATMAGRTKELTIIGTDAVRILVQEILNLSQSRLSFEINFINITDSKDSIEFNHFSVTTVALSHRVPSWAYIFTEKKIMRKLDIQKLNADGIDSGPVWNQIQKEHDVILSDGKTIRSEHYLLKARKPRKIIIAGDNDTPDLLSAVSKEANVLVHEATYTADVAEKIGITPQHSSAKIVAEFARDHSIRNLILTHFSPRYQPFINSKLSIDDVKNEAKEFYDGHLFLANDFDTFHLNIDGEIEEAKPKEFKHLTIVSGGQTGVDRAALDAAIENEIRCGGWCPKGRKAEDGVIPEKYPLIEFEQAGYRQRTKKNVQDSDGTMIVYFKYLTGGTELTLKFCINEKKPYLLLDADDLSVTHAAKKIRAFVEDFSIKKLNVAGPRGSREPRAYHYTKEAVTQFILSQ